MKQHVAGIALVAIVVAVLQGKSVDYGLLLDDYNHRASLLEGDFSFGSLVEASHLGGAGRRVEMWWQDEADLYFFRPLAFAFMRAEYVLGGWSPAVMHAFSLGWGVVCAALVMLLAHRTTGSAFWSTLAGVLFVMHPGNFLTPRWIACQNEQMATAFILSGLLLYGTYSGWWRVDLPAGRGASLARLGGALLCFVLALGCRESALMFGPMLVLGDLLTHPRQFGRRWRVYVAVAVLCGAYLAARHACLGGFALPGRPYACPPGTPGFARFIVDKFMYYVLGLFAYFPIIGFGGLRFLRSHPAWFYGSFAAVVAGGSLLLWRLRHQRSIRLWGAMALVPLLPVLPVFASAHHLYLASAGMVLALVSAGWAIVSRDRDRGASRWRPGRVAVGVLVVGHLTAFCWANGMYDQGIAGLCAAGRYTVEDVVRLGDPLQPHDRLFFINLPLLSFNCVSGVAEASGASPLRAYALTFGPTLLTMNRTGRVERAGRNQLRVYIDGEGYFSSQQGRSLLEAAGRERPFAVGESYTTDDFQVWIVRADQSGIQELLFTFDRPLEDPSYHFFFGSRVFFAYPLRFGEPNGMSPGGL